MFFFIIVIFIIIFFFFFFFFFIFYLFIFFFFFQLLQVQENLYIAWAYSPFHSSLPFEHLGQSSLFTPVCHLIVCKSGNFLFYFRTETVSQVPGVHKIYSAFMLR